MRDDGRTTRLALVRRDHELVDLPLPAEHLNDLRRRRAAVSR